jgi:hypothetical protein
MSRQEQASEWAKGYYDDRVASPLIRERGRVRDRWVTAFEDCKPLTLVLSSCPRGEARKRLHDIRATHSFHRLLQCCRIIE